MCFGFKSKYLSIGLVIPGYSYLYLYFLTNKMIFGML